MISAGRQNTCGITLDNDAYCWGRDNEGQFGDGATETLLVTRFQEDLVTGGVTSSATYLQHFIPFVLYL